MIDDAEGWEETMSAIQQYVVMRLRLSDRGARWWSTSYHAAFGIAGVLGIMVSLMAGLDDRVVDGPARDIIIAVMSALSAVLTFIGGFGGFERKWRANRWMRAEMQKLLLDLSGGEVEKAGIRTRLFAAIDRHEASISGELGAGAKIVDDLQSGQKSTAKTAAEDTIGAKNAEGASTGAI